MLERIEVKNFKSLKHLSYKCAQLNLLTGVNGAGKSSFVQLLLMLRKLVGKLGKVSVKIQLNELEEGQGSEYKDILYRYANPNDRIYFSVDFSAEEDYVEETTDGDLFSRPRLVESKIERIIREGEMDGVIYVEHPDFAAKDLAYSSLIKGAGTAFLKKKNEDEHFKQEIERLYKERDEAKKRLKAEESGKDEVYKSLWRGMKFVSAFRDKPHEEHAVSNFENRFLRIEDVEDLPGNVHSLVPEIRFSPEGSDVVGFLSKVGGQFEISDCNPYVDTIYECRMILSEGESTEHDKLLNVQVQRWMNFISPGAKIFFEEVKVGSTKKVVMSVGFGEGGALQRFQPQNVGFGISYILPVLVTLLTSQPGDIVVIENPEAHLHPRGQSAMGNLIARAAASGIQLFVETHSDHVINGIRVAVKDGIIKPKDVNIAFFERKGHDIENSDGTTHKEYYAEERDIKIDSQGSLSEYPEDFMDEWNNQLMELMK